MPGCRGSCTCRGVTFSVSGTWGPVKPRRGNLKKQGSGSLGEAGRAPGGGWGRGPAGTGVSLNLREGTQAPWLLWEQPHPPPSKPPSGPRSGQAQDTDHTLGGNVCFIKTLLAVGLPGADFLPGCAGLQVGGWALHTYCPAGTTKHLGKMPMRPSQWPSSHAESTSHRTSTTSPGCKSRSSGPWAE